MDTALIDWSFPLKKNLSQLWRTAKMDERNRSMFRLLDTNTQDLIAHFATRSYAKAAAKSLSGEQKRRITVLFAQTILPIARYVDGEEIAVTATLHRIGY